MLHLGLDIGGTKMEAVLLDEQGNSITRERRPTCKTTYHEFMQELLSLIGSIRQRSPVPFSVGIGLPGALDPVSHVIKNSNCLVLNGRDLKADLSRALQQPVWLANDADCFTLSEAVDGAGAGAGTVFGVIIGTGCGGGIVVNRALLSGPNAIVGEWGHNPLPGYDAMQDGPAQQCYCGKLNCIETFISGTGFSRRFGANITAPEIMSLVSEGEPAAVAHWAHFIGAFSRSLASVINILDPHVIVLGGGLSNVDLIYETLPDSVVPWLFSGTCRTRIVKAKYGDSSGVRGAAWLPTMDMS